MIDSKDPENFMLEELRMPEPVFMASIECESLKDRPQLETAIKYIEREDTSLRFEENKETSQLIVRGLGELHLEVMMDRMKQDFGVKAKLGKMKVSYRECIQNSIQ